MCFYHLLRLRQVRRRVGAEVTTQLVLAVITARLDYCNSVLASVPQTTLEPLKLIQKVAARLIFALGLREQVTQGLFQLHGRQYVGAFNTHIIDTPGEMPNLPELHC